MGDASKIDPKQFGASMKTEMNSGLESMIQAGNSDPDGEWIATSEGQPWNFSAEFRKPVFD